GFGRRTEYLVGDGEQQRPQQGEPFGVFTVGRAGGGAHGHRTVSGSGTGAGAAERRPRYQIVAPGLRASRRMDHSVPFTTASLISAGMRPRRWARSGESSARVNWATAARRPSPTVDPTYASANGAGSAPSSRLSTVSAAVAAVGAAA